MRIAALFLAVSAIAAAQEVEGVVSREYAIKAGVIGLLGKCVVWPPDHAPSRQEPLKIGILGKDPFNENGVNQLDRVVEQERRKGSVIVVRRFDSAKDYEPCHILFVSSLAADRSPETSIERRVEAAKQLTAGAKVLLVGESKQLAAQDAIANLIFDRATNLVRLEINPDAASRAGLTLAPDLLRLKVVRIVRDSQE